MSDLPPVFPAVPSGPLCAGRGGVAVVQWQRRLTDAELAEYTAAEQSRRNQALPAPNLPADWPPGSA